MNVLKVVCILLTIFNSSDFDFHAHQDKLIFRVVGDKRFIDGKEIITGDNIHILVFREYCPCGPIDFIKNDDGKNIDIQIV